MKWKLSLLIALVVGGIGGSAIKELPGFVIIAYDKTSVEMRLWVAVFFILLAFVLLFFTIKIGRSIFASAGRVKSWSSDRSAKRARRKTTQGMLAFTEGRWKASEDAMIGAAKNSDTKLINYLIAAQAAQHQNAEVRRDAYLRQAHLAEPDAKTAIRLTQAQLQLQHNQYEQALASLNELKAINPNHPYVLKLLGELYERLQDWTRMIELIPALKKQQVYQGEALQDYEKRGIAGLLSKQAELGQIEQLTDAWQNLPAQYRKTRCNILIYAELLIEFDQMDEAEALIRPLLKKQADSQVISLYGKVVSSDPAKQLTFLEAWQKGKNQTPVETFLTLGKIAYHAKLWGKARFFLERALQIDPNAEAYLYMAKTLQQLDDQDHANDCFRLGLEYAAIPNSEANLLALPDGSDDMVNSDVLPKFQKLESKG
ncbi:heme biosynthesis protein HemY [Aliikangiella marina]|uniref:Heme biosynthesis protein HemY n=1 Tax=Aliikangiella marina TaxID=1712262 RepID=A0A545T4J7_9GAMM|nr:heme biosynthesis HemY N-terminal domain-containing protein [Aliikangiella marina]TQV72139.1 heme biosynthesis protein HemY [Aliikangiella marina]